MTDLQEQFGKLPEQTQTFLLDLVSKTGINPLGERLIKNSRIHQIKYGDDNWTWFVGQEVTVPTKNGGVDVKIKEIYMDWLTSVELNVPVHVLVGRRLDGTGGNYIMRYVAQKQFDVVCEPPKNSN